MLYKVKTIKIEYKIKENMVKATINKAELAVELLRQIYQELDVDQEHFCILALNNHLNITGYKIISSGGQSSATIDPKIVFRNALLLGAANIILAHNHPSGNITASNQDIEITKKLKECGELLQINVIDHIIFSQQDYSHVVYQ